MDFYGIGAALKTAMALYSVEARQTGRSTALIESLHEGDLVICSTPAEARWLQDETKARRGFTVKAKCTRPGNIHEAFAHTEGHRGRVIFDHSWVEAFYTAALHGAVSELDRATRFIQPRAASPQPERMARCHRYDRHPQG